MQTGQDSKRKSPSPGLEESLIIDIDIKEGDMSKQDIVPTPILSPRETELIKFLEDKYWEVASQLKETLGRSYDISELDKLNSKLVSLRS